MPVIVIGADTATGLAIIDELTEPGREVRAFVSDPEIVADLKRRGIKVALGDVSDESHVEAAALHCFTAVLIGEAAGDGRERSFAKTEIEVLGAWSRAVAHAEITRVIWVYDGDPPAVAVPEVATVSPADTDLARRVSNLDDARSLS
jgi:putative NADH-flavin reductase